MFKSLFQSVLDFLFPVFCVLCEDPGGIVCKNCFDKFYFYEGHRELSLSQNDFLGIYFAVDYSTFVKDVIVAYKDFQLFLVANFFVDNWMRVWRKQIFSQYLGFSDSLVVFIPVPSSAKNVRKRGFSHTVRLAKVFAKNFKVKYFVVDILSVVGVKKDQVGLSGDQRFVNVSGSFGINWIKLILLRFRIFLFCKNSRDFDKSKNVVYVLVDDTVTSGASMISAAEILIQVGVTANFGISFSSAKKFF